MKSQYRSKKVTLMSRVRVDGVWRRFDAKYGKSGRVIPGLVIRKGHELRFPEVSYELRYYERGKVHYKRAGKNATDAEEQRRTLAAQLSAKSVAKSAGIEIELDTDRKLLNKSAQSYLDKQSVLVGPDQLQRMRYENELFSESCKKTYIDELTEVDFLNYIRLLSSLPAYRNLRANPSARRNAAQRRIRYPVEHRTISRRTMFSYYTGVKKWLCECGVNPKLFPPPPRFEQPEVTIYSPEQIKSLFDLVKGDLRIALALMLKCGLRRREVAFAYFSDINFADKTILVQGKPEWKFTVKNRIQRYIPIPDDLLEELRYWASEHPGQRLIIQTKKRVPALRLIRDLKRFVYLHGLRCGRCGHCNSGNPDCEDWELHKFRRTYITGILRHVDLRTAQEYAGHSRISSTERYLRPASATEGQSRVSSIDWTVPFYMPKSCTTDKGANNDQAKLQSKSAQSGA
jgi:integrase